MFCEMLSALLEREENFQLRRAIGVRWTMDNLPRLAAFAARNAVRLQIRVHLRVDGVALPPDITLEHHMHCLARRRLADLNADH